MDYILSDLKQCFIDISFTIKNNSSLELSKKTNVLNESGDNTKLLDQLCHNILTDKLLKNEFVHQIISEESEDIIKSNTNGDFLVCYDPLDGSSNIDVNVGTGTIFCIFNKDNKSRGSSILCAGYCIYSCSTQLILAKNNKVELYQLIDNDFKLIKGKINIPQKGNSYMINTAYKNEWISHNYDKNIIKDLNNMKYNMRWTGSLVLDAHRLLLTGGFFSYPVNNKNISGKIRLVYEAFPIAYIICCAGGFALSLYDEILKLRFSNDIHEKTELRLFSREEYLRFIEKRDYKN